MPFGMTLHSLAAEGEFKQSCVTFAFYFMFLLAYAPGDGTAIVSNIAIRFCV